jgi:signal peptidase II
MKPPEPAHTRAQAWSWALVLTGAVIAFDQITKQVAVAAIDRGDPVEVMFGFELANVRNKGVAFGLLAGGKVPVLLLTLAAIGLLVVYFGLHVDKPGLWVAVGLVSGGALGNLADRVRSGSVIDFLDPPVWPAFNVADIAIVAGVALLILSLTTLDARASRKNG